MSSGLAEASPESLLSQGQGQQAFEHYQPRARALSAICEKSQKWPLDPVTPSIMGFPGIWGKTGKKHFSY